MHCHNADQTFYVIDGECTMHFPDGGKAVLKPGQAALITGRSFYQLEHGFRAHDYDGQSFRTGRENPDYRLCNTQGRPRKSSADFKV
jgi:hypothetical protein